MLYYGRIFESRELKIITGVLITQVAPLQYKQYNLFRLNILAIFLILKPYTNYNLIYASNLCIINHLHYNYLSISYS